MNYETASDYEINEAVAKLLGSKKTERNPNGKLLPSLRNMVITDGGSRDYCNNASDAWPIILDKQIDIISPTSCSEGLWQAQKFYITFWPVINQFCANPLRAAMIVYLMMNEVE